MSLKEKAEKVERAVKPKKVKKGPQPPTPYLCFCKAIRPVVIAENPQATFGELSKLIGAKWTKMTDTEKEVYVHMAAEAKVAFYETHGTPNQQTISYSENLPVPVVELEYAPVVEYSAFQLPSSNNHAS